jgi:hypothetical protein
MAALIFFPGPERGKFHAAEREFLCDYANRVIYSRTDPT